MATESKKLLQTTLDMFDADPWKPGESMFVWSDKAIMELEHDARLAHEMREAIRRQDAALRAALEALELYHAYGWPDRAGVRAKLKTEIAAAAPFLED